MFKIIIFGGKVLKKSYSFQLSGGWILAYVGMTTLRKALRQAQGPTAPDTTTFFSTFPTFFLLTINNFSSGLRGLGLPFAVQTLVSLFSFNF